MRGLARVLLLGLVALCLPSGAGATMLWNNGGGADLPVISVTDYGARCNDSTNDTTAIQAAIDAAEATGQGGIVEFPVGICVVTGLTVNEPGITLRGQGAAESNNATVLSCNLTTGTCLTLGSSCTFCGVEDMIVATRSAPTDAVMIDGTSAAGDFVDRVHLVSSRYCTGLKNIASIKDVNLFSPVAGASCRGISIVDNGVFMDDVKGNWSTDIEGMIVIEQTSTNLVDTVQASKLEIAQSGGAGAALKFIGNGATNPARWVRISDSFFEAKTTSATTGDYAIHIGNVRDFECSNCYAQGGYRSVVIEGGPGPIVFNGGSFGNSQREAVYHDADVPTWFIGSLISDASFATDNTYSDVYLSANSRGFVMLGGKLGADYMPTFSNNVPKYGVEVISGADEYRFSDVACDSGIGTSCTVGLSTSATQAAFTDAVTFFAGEQGLIQSDTGLDLDVPTTSLWPSGSGTLTSSQDLLDFSNTLTFGGGSQTFNGFEHAPTATISAATNIVRAVGAGGSYTTSSAGPIIMGLGFYPTIDNTLTTDPLPVYQVNGLNCAPTLTSSTSSGAIYQDCFVDGTTINYSGSSNVSATTNPWAPFSLLTSGTTKTSGTGDLTINQIASVKYQGVFDAENASSTLTVNNLNGLSMVGPDCAGNNCGAGNVAVGALSGLHLDMSTALDTGMAITTAYGVRLTDLDKATTNYSLYSNSGSAMLYNGGVIDAGDNIADPALLTKVGALDVSPTIDITNLGANFSAVKFMPTTSITNVGGIIGLYMEPTVTTSNVGTYDLVRIAGTFTQTASSSAASLMTSTATFTSATAGIAPINSLRAVNNTSTVSSSASSSTATSAFINTADHSPTLSNTGAGTHVVTNDTAFNVAGTYSRSAGTMTVATRTGLKINDVTLSGSATVTNNIGVDIAPLANGTTLRAGMRNADTTVYTPCTDNITGNTDYLARPDCTAVNLTAGAARDLTSGTDQIADGLDGQIVTYFFSGSNSITFDDADNLNLASATRALSAGDTLTLLFSSTLGTWIEVGFANN